jgi:hypothetical protein
MNFKAKNILKNNTYHTPQHNVFDIMMQSVF